MMHIQSGRLWVVLALSGVGLFSTGVVAAEATGIAGTWRGQSLCVTDAPACHNENVVYYIKEVPDRSDRVVIQADKIVDGKAITMGTGEWQHDRVRHTLEWQMPERVWLLKVAGTRIEGTLKLADGTLARKMTLEKDK